MRVLVITYCIVITAGSSGLFAQSNTGSAAAPAPRSYVLGAGDQVSVWVADSEELSSRPLRVDHTGTIRVPLVGQVEVAGLSTAQVEVELAQRLSRYMKKPQVTVSVTEYRSQPVSVMGAVHTPGVQQLQGHRTLMELLSMAGGVTQDAGAVARITRQAVWGPIPLPGAKTDPSGQFSIAEVNLKSLMTAEAPESNIAIRPNDVITVPRAQMVYVIGEVGRSGGFLLNDRKDMSTLQALSMAGGLLRTASPKKAKVLRMQANGERTEVAVDLRKVLDGKVKDVSLNPDDILFVPSSTSKRAAIRAAEAIVQTATGVVVWRGGQF